MFRVCVPDKNSFLNKPKLLITHSLIQFFFSQNWQWLYFKKLFSSNTVDRIIIQLYMFLVLFSIIYLLIVNNPPEKFMADIKKAPEMSSSSATTVVNSH